MRANGPHHLISDGVRVTFGGRFRRPEGAGERVEEFVARVGGALHRQSEKGRGSRITDTMRRRAVLTGVNCLDVSVYERCRFDCVADRRVCKQVESSRKLCRAETERFDSVNQRSNHLLCPVSRLPCNPRQPLSS